MHILVNNQLAAIKKGTSFEFVSENRMFSGSDGYSLTITFPLRGCPQNVAIFGHINRADVAARQVVFDCEIRDRGFSLFGAITITEISETEVKTQFLEGRSEQNFNRTLDDIYINELDLGTPPTTSSLDITPAQAWDPVGNNFQCVALPWVNDSSGNIQNLATCDAATGAYAWDKDCRGLSWQPYLLHLTRKICEAVEYTHDFTPWEESEEHKYLLICNALPAAWNMPAFAQALPHWTVKEYFEKLELFLGGEFDIDHRGHSIAFHFTADTVGAKPAVLIDNVIDEHSAEVKDVDDGCEYSETKILAYKDCDHRMWKFYSCAWFLRDWDPLIKRFDTLQELINHCKKYRYWDGRPSSNFGASYIFYAMDCDAHFVLTTMSRRWVTELTETSHFWQHYEYTCRLQPVNLFGERIPPQVDEDKADSQEIEFVPAWIDETDEEHGRALFLKISGYDDDGTAEAEDEELAFRNIASVNILTAGEKEKKAEYIDRIYIGWYDGANRHKPLLPRPDVDDVEVAEDFSSYRILHFSLRLNDRNANARRALPRITPRIRASFKFLSDAIPDVRSVFIIRGKRYICEKITATFTENGMSRLLKGVFYPLAD